MTAYETLWEVAVDHHGLISSTEATNLGVSRQSVVSMAKSGMLIRIAPGVYQVKHYSPQPEEDVYAVCVASAGATAYLRGASVIGLLKLAPTNPAIVYVGATGRVRRKLPRGCRVKDRRPCEVVMYNGIKCQPIKEALRTALREGSIEADRIASAAQLANEQGMITNEECAEFQN